MEIEVNKEEGFIVLNFGERKYKVIPESKHGNLYTERLLLHRDLVDYIDSVIQDSVSDEEIKTYLGYRYPVCKSSDSLFEGMHLMRNIIIKEATKIANWMYNKIHTRVRKKLNTTIK